MVFLKVDGLFIGLLATPIKTTKNTKNLQLLTATNLRRLKVETTIGITQAERYLVRLL